MISVIDGTGKFLPEKILTNRDLEKMVSTSDEWIVERTGIRNRRIADGNVSASDLALPAAKQALESAGLKPEDVELIIVGTSTPDMLFPSTACFVQAKLGASRAVAFDLLAACSGFIFALAAADNYIKSGAYKNALVIGAEVYSSIVDWQDRTTCVLFGDGAGAVALKAQEGTSDGILSTHIFSDGSKADYLYAPGGGSSQRFSTKMINEKQYCLKMQGRKTFTVAVKKMVQAARIALSHNSVSTSDLKLVIPHQANRRIIEAVARQLGMNIENFFFNIEKYGNTAAASLPIALDEAIREGRVVKGDLVLTVTFGGGFTWGSALIRL
ncbi:MAG: 3-oxoacyl-[acyl-carrier-protein] synthase 3 [bacterium]|nr:MAG: 3-oxoacyl-[acyl-carrier-protein] synthase 3 [bacterium]